MVLNNTTLLMLKSKFKGGNYTMLQKIAPVNDGETLVNKFIRILVKIVNIKFFKQIQYF